MVKSPFTILLNTHIQMHWTRTNGRMNDRDVGVECDISCLYVRNIANNIKYNGENYRRAIAYAHASANERKSENNAKHVSRVAYCKMKVCVEPYTKQH